MGRGAGGRCGKASSALPGNQLSSRRAPINAPSSRVPCSVQENKLGHNNKGLTNKQQKQQREKMCGPPCFRSVCGMPLQKAVYIIGLIELIITVSNVVKYSQFVNEEDCEGKDVCIGPIIKYC